MVELGIDMFGDLRIDPTTGKAEPAAQRMQEIIEEVKLMDEVGLDFIAMGEHHREDFVVTSPEIMLAAAASVTKNIKLGSAVSVLSSTDPVKLFQDFVSVDLISDGRAEIMVGRGSFIESFPLFGYDLNVYSELFEEKLELLLQLNKEERITWFGRFRAPLFDQPILSAAKERQTTRLGGCWWHYLLRYSGSKIEITGHVCHYRRCGRKFQAALCSPSASLGRKRP